VPRKNTSRATVSTGPRASSSKVITLSSYRSAFRSSLYCTAQKRLI
jgi:hypothetical protein